MPYRRITDPERLQALIAAMLLIEADLELPVVLQRIVEQATVLSGAHFGAMGVVDEAGEALAQFITVGLSPEERRAIGALPTGRGILGQLILHPEALRLDDLKAHPAAAGFPAHHPPMGPFLGVPVRVRDAVFGNLYLCKYPGEPGFSEEDEDLITSLGTAAGLVIDKARLHERLRELTLVEERERMARNLHDTVIQQLFAAGLRLQGVAVAPTQEEATKRVNEVIDDLDETIRQIRTTIFAISRRSDQSRGLRAQILELTDEVGGRLGLDVRVNLIGPIDTLADSTTGEHLVVTLREAMTNVVRHAQANRADVTVTVGDGTVTLVVSDDGVGVDPAALGQGRGLGNLSERARLLRGECTLEAGADGGSVLTWRVRPG